MNVTKQMSVVQAMDAKIFRDHMFVFAKMATGLHQMEEHVLVRTIIIVEFFVLHKSYHTVLQGFYLFFCCPFFY